MEIDVNPIRKRPDVIQRLKDRKGKQERVIKCSLVGRLTEKRLLSPILSWVHTISRISNKGSLVFNRLLLHCLFHLIPLPDLSNQTLYLQCFNGFYKYSRRRCYNPNFTIFSLFYNQLFNFCIYKIFYTFLHFKHRFYLHKIV